MEAKKETGDHLRKDNGKVRWSLLPWKSIYEVLLVFEFGANKYSPNGWREGMDWDRVYNSLQRHLYKWWVLKEKYDEETGIHHLAHVIVNALFLLTYEKEKLGKDLR